MEPNHYFADSATMNNKGDKSNNKETVWKLDTSV